MEGCCISHDWCEHGLHQRLIGDVSMDVNRLFADLIYTVLPGEGAI